MEITCRSFYTIACPRPCLKSAMFTEAYHGPDWQVHSLTRGLDDYKYKVLTTDSMNIMLHMRLIVDM